MKLWHFTEIREGWILTSTSLSWLAKQSSTRHSTVTAAAQRVTCANGFGLTRRHVSVPWGVKSITTTRHASTPNVTKVLATAVPGASSFGRPPRCCHLVNSTTRAQKLTAPSAISHDLPTTLRMTLLSLVRSRVVAAWAVRLPDPLHPFYSTLILLFSFRNTDNFNGQFFHYTSF